MMYKVTYREFTETVKSVDICAENMTKACEKLGLVTNGAKTNIMNIEKIETNPEAHALVTCGTK